jgi:hypothetical protein
MERDDSLEHNLSQISLLPASDHEEVLSPRKTVTIQDYNNPFDLHSATVLAPTGIEQL